MYIHCFNFTIHLIMTEVRSKRRFLPFSFIVNSFLEDTVMVKKRETSTPFIQALNWHGTPKSWHGTNEGSIDPVWQYLERGTHLQRCDRQPYNSALARVPNMPFVCSVNTQNICRALPE